MNWRPTVLAAEVWLNLRSRAATWIVVAGMSAVIVGALTAAELDAGSRSIQLRQELDRAGADVVVVEVPSDPSAGSGSLDTSRCLALNDVRGIERAGSERVLDPVEIASAPGSPIIVVETSGPTVAIWDPAAGDDRQVSSGVWATTSLRDRLGVDVSSHVAVDSAGQPVKVVGVFEPLRAPHMGARLVRPGPSTGRSDRCWVEVASPLSQDKLIAISSSFFADAPVVVRPLVDGRGPQVDPQAQYDDRPTRVAWAVVGLAVGALWVLVVRPRRSEIALLMTIGTNRLCAAGHVVAEVLVVALVVWCVGAGIGVTWWRFAHPPSMRPGGLLLSGLGSATMATSLAMSIAAAGVVLLSFGSKLQALKDRD